MVDKQSEKQAETLSMEHSDTDDDAPKQLAKKARRARVRNGSAPGERTDSSRHATIRQSDAEVELLAKKAAHEISAMIEISQGVAKGCLYDWHAKYKPALGSYKKFVLSRSGEFSVTDIDGDGNFVVTKSGVKPPEGFMAGRGTRCWQRHATLAWNKYCEVTPAETRSLEASFLTILEAAKRETGAVAAVEVPVLQVERELPSAVEAAGATFGSGDVSVGTLPAPVRKKQTARARQRLARQAFERSAK